MKRNRRLILKIIILICSISILYPLFVLIHVSNAESKEQNKIKKILTRRINEVEDKKISDSIISNKNIKKRDIINNNIKFNPEYNKSYNNTGEPDTNNAENNLNNKNNSIDSNEHRFKNKSNNDNIPIGFDVIISIPDIGLEKIVYTGEHRQTHLNNYELITATQDMKYKNGGNYIICGHASRIYGHSLNRLNEVNKGDKVYIHDLNSIDKYIVISIEYEIMYDTEKFCEQTKDNQITILSCANYIADNKYIVIKCKKEK